MGVIPSFPAENQQAHQSPQRSDLSRQVRHGDCTCVPKKPQAQCFKSPIATYSGLNSWNGVVGYLSIKANHDHKLMGCVCVCVRVCLECVLVGGKRVY